MTSSMHDLSSHADNGGLEEQQKQHQQQLQHQYSTGAIFQSTSMASPSVEYLMPRSHLEVGHNVAQPAYPYPDPYYGSLLAAYGAHAVMHPHMMGIHQAGLPLPTDAVEEPVYVNAKQYHGILRRRQSRAKAESENKLIKSRKPYLHESRHLHALRRARGCGGRFLNAKTDEDQQNKYEDQQNNSHHPNNSNSSHNSITLGKEHASAEQAS
ncbi:nuclear transcription factor Y subunit A-7 isoform X2 [Amborella trichopoda]|uniref:nuclear transcription factor Y subunit A-7 isoform X2 n=1 Tax=Amborella trichopoda TaxID=13333 RepID=UPI0005D30837|nr:nuclear transcription factor Y subunit A-7 isoform X2 [Amborella trichopoda]|eukprot:XP_011624032.1 nuclear transcription factor Y subunit A-7 isoform X2 [Amborella trichopoda]